MSSEQLQQLVVEHEIRVELEQVRDSVRERPPVDENPVAVQVGDVEVAAVVEGGRVRHRVEVVQGAVRAVALERIVM